MCIFLETANWETRQLEGNNGNSELIFLNIVRHHQASMIILIIELLSKNELSKNVELLVMVGKKEEDDPFSFKKFPIINKEDG